jgi:phosphatidylglycerophosphate synthase
VSAASPLHSVKDPTARFLGVIKVAPGERAALADAAGRVAAVGIEPGPGWEENVVGDLRRAQADIAAGREPDIPDGTVVPPPSVELDAEIERRRVAALEDATAPLLVGLVRANAMIGAAAARELFWERPLTRAQAERAAMEIQRYDEDKALLDSAVKGADGFFTTFFVSPYSRYIARWAARRGLTPNQVTVFSMFLGVLAAAGFATGERWGLIAGAVLLQAAFTFDCVDGQLARYTRTFSKFGAWLDSVFDRAKEYAAFAGLAIGAAAAGDPAWLLAGAAITLQTARHTMEFAWAATMHAQMGAIQHPPLDEPRDDAMLRAEAAAERRAKAQATARAAPAPAAPSASGPRRLLRRAVSAWTALDKNPRAMWFKRIVAFPIGERFAVISLMAALTTPRTTLIVVLAIGSAAALYSITGRVLRSIAA